MLDIGWMELMVIGVVALLVVGPKELPGLLRTIGRYIAMAKRQADQFRAQFDEAIRETEFDDIRREMDDIRSGRFAEPKKPDDKKTEDQSNLVDDDFEDQGPIEPAPEFRDEEETTSFTMADGTVVRKGEPPVPPAQPKTETTKAAAPKATDDAPPADGEAASRNAETVR